MIETTASKLPRRMTCPGSGKMGLDLPNRAVDPSRKEQQDLGDAAHYMAQQVINGQFELSELIDRKAPNGVYMTDDMHDHVQVYLDEVLPWGCDAEGVTDWGGQNYRINGRADHKAYVPQQRFLRITDFKYGWGITDPYLNWTLISHAIGEVIRLQIDWPETIEFVIVQPRPPHREGPVRRHQISGQELYNLYLQIDQHLNNPPEILQTSPHCRGCRAAAVCPAARAVDYNTIDMTESVFEDDLSDNDTGVELAALKIAAARLKHRIDAVEEHAVHKAKKGAIIPGFALQQHYGRDAWKDGVTAETLEAMTGVKATKPKLLTPKQYVNAGAPQAFVDAMTHKPSHGSKLEKVSANSRGQALFGKASK